MRRLLCWLGAHRWTLYTGERTGRLMRRCERCGVVQTVRVWRDTLYGETTHMGARWVGREPTLGDYY